MKMKTSELTGAALDWAVARVENPEWSDEDCIVNVTMFDEYTGTLCNYSTDWAQGGAVIERERITVSATPSAEWYARTTAYPPEYVAGPTPLIAAMRCYVASKLGDEVAIPEELSGDPSEPGHPANPRSQY